MRMRSSQAWLIGFLNHVDYPWFAQQGLERQFQLKLNCYRNTIAITTLSTIVHHTCIKKYKKKTKKKKNNYEWFYLCPVLEAQTG